MSLPFFVKDQLGRIDRKVESLKDSSDMKEGDFNRLKDAFLDFCIQCYHLRDVLIQTRYKPQEEIDLYIRSSRYLSRCRYFANKSKHLLLHNEQGLRTVGEVMIPVSMSYDPWENKLQLSVPVAHRALVMNCHEFAYNARNEWRELLQE